MRSILLNCSNEIRQHEFDVALAFIRHSSFNGGEQIEQ